VASFTALTAINFAEADTILWVEDYSGEFAPVDVTNHTVGAIHTSALSTQLDGIAFIGANLYGSTINGLYSIDIGTGAATQIGPNYNLGASGMSSLFANGAGLLGASVNTLEVYNISPSNAAMSAFAPTTHESGGGFAYSGASLYESGINVYSYLVNITTDTTVGVFHTANMAPFSDANVALAGDGQTVYAFSGTEVYTVDVSNALLTPLFGYGGHGLGAAYGASFGPNESGGVPELSTWALMLLGFAGMASRAIALRAKPLQSPPDW
jgi:hypothetical protein